VARTAQFCIKENAIVATKENSP